jgi:hypothetical protein
MSPIVLRRHRFDQGVTLLELAAPLSREQSGAVVQLCSTDRDRVALLLGHLCLVVGCP